MILGDDLFKRGVDATILQCLSKTKAYVALAEMRMTLQLVDRSITRPYSVIEDVLVWIKQFNSPADFVVMDIEEDFEIPFILGWPLMLTASCVVDMGKKKLELGIDNQKISFDLFDEEKHLSDQNVCLQVKEFDEKVLKERTKIDPG